jgi:hypothetical protein
MKPNDLHKTFTSATKRINTKKKKTRLGSQAYLTLCIEQAELNLRCLRAVYWASHCGEV